MSRHDFWVKEALEHFGHHTLNPREVDNELLRGIIDVVHCDLFSTLLEKRHRELFNWELVNVRQRYILLDLTWHQHISYYVSRIKVMEAAEKRRGDLVSCQYSLQASHIHGEHRLQVLSSAVNVKQPRRD